MMNRREVFRGLSALALMGMVAEAQTSTEPEQWTTKVFKTDSLTQTHNATGGGGRAMPQGTMPAAEIVNIHITIIDPGKTYGPMHKTSNHEFLLMQEGKLELEFEGGKPSLSAEAGDIVFSAANEMHTSRNVGDKPLAYFVVVIKPKATS